MVKQRDGAGKRKATENVSENENSKGHKEHSKKDGNRLNCQINSLSIGCK